MLCGGVCVATIRTKIENDIHKELKKKGLFIYSERRLPFTDVKGGLFINMSDFFNICSLLTVYYWIAVIFRSSQIRTHNPRKAEYV